MTREEKFAKDFIQTKLSREGYPTYANLLSYFDLNLTERPDTIAYLDPSKGRIVVNRGLDEDQVSVVIRHEILHNYLEHEQRLLKKLAREANMDYDKLDDLELQELKQNLYKNRDFNIAGDYEISNLAYTDRDKETIRQININGNILCGLVTEDDHPDWVELSVEEMFDKLKEEREKRLNELPKYYGYLINATTFIDLNGVIYGV